MRSSSPRLIARSRPSRLEVMTRIAHLTDLHLNGSPKRRAQFEVALAEAKAHGATWLLLTGDLTGHGKPREFHELAGCLERSWPHDATIVGGNHDGAGFQPAIQTGCLSRFAATSLSGSPVELDDVVILPVDTYFARRALLFRAIGQVGDTQYLQVARAIENYPGKPIVVAMHHGPQADPLRTVAGLVDGQKMLGLLRHNPNVSVCCGHDHRILDLGTIHVAASVAHHDDPLRLYDIVDGKFESAYRNPDGGGRYF
jgi:Icc protein